MSFNKWKDEYGLEFEPNYSKETELDCKAAFEAGQQSKQAEIEELHKRVKELELINFDSELHFDAAKEHINHLQKRIDEVVHILTYTNHASTTLCNELREILKGNTNEH